MNDKQQQKLEVHRGCSGLGLFASEPIPKGVFIVSYKGKVVPTKRADALKTRYLFEIDETYTIDGKQRDNIARYMNHFCDPNVEAEIEAGQVNFYALRNIEDGEELGYDYGEEYFDEFIKPVGCCCPNCS